MKKLLIPIIGALLLLIGEGASAQTKHITGKVTYADDGQPVAGAAVIIKGTTSGVSTDADGNFSISVPNNYKTLVVSFVGMQTAEVEVAPNMAIVLNSDNQNLDAVVVTAMGITKERKALGYAVQDVKSDELTQASNANIATALQGKVSGVEITPSSGMPGASAKITIRGSRSFTGNNTPLYVIDGQPIASTYDISTGSSTSGADYSNRSIDLDPSDIESINVLKGQAASALYGMRANNGVIVITTKNGSSARGGKAHITINSSVSFENLSTTPEIQTKYAQGSNGLYNPTSSLSWGPLISELPNDPNYGGNTSNKYTSADGAHQGMYYVPQRKTAGLDPWTTPGVYDNIGEFFQTGLTLNNNINVTQNNGNNSYSFSIGNTRQDGIVPSTGLTRYNAKIGGTAQLGKNFKTGFSGNFVTSKITKQTGANNGIIATVYPAPPSYDLKGIPCHADGDPYTQNTYRGTGSFDAAYWAIENNQFIERNQRFFGNAYIQYETGLGRQDMKLIAKYQLGEDAYTSVYTNSWGYGHSNGTGSLSKSSYTKNNLNSLFTLTYNWYINPELEFNALYGNEFDHRQTEYTYGYGSNYNFGGWNSINNATYNDSGADYYKSRTFGNFVNASLSWKSMLYFNATARADKVSSMPRDHRTFFYPSVSLSWIFTEIPMFKNDVLTFGKIRTSYAEVGMAGSYHDSYYSTPSYGSGFSSSTPLRYPMNGVVAFTPTSTVYDPDLVPQNTRSYEIGADLSFFDGLVSINYTFSRQNVKDQIFSIPLARSTGFSSLNTNGGSIHTNAHELTIGVFPINTDNVKWDFNLNFSKIDNYVDKLAEGVNSIFLGGFVEPQVRAGIGDKFPVIYGVSYLRDDNGNLIVDEDGLPQAGEEKVLGAVSPDFQLGLSTTLEVYKAKLSAVFDWKSGGKMYAATPGMLDYYGVSQRSADLRDTEYFIIDGVKADGTKNDIKIYGSLDEAKANGAASAQDFLSAENDITESMVKTNSYIKLRELVLSYPVLDKKWLRIDASAFARNIILWSTLKGFDPESSQGNNNMGGGFERFSLPGATSYGFGLSLKF